MFVERLLEVAATSCSGNALTYIHEVADSLDCLDRMSGQEPVPVHERAVERVLAHVRNGTLQISQSYEDSYSTPPQNLRNSAL
jgi:hypothetical protein